MIAETTSPVVALDTSVIISGLLSWHEHHGAASAALIQVLESEAKVLIPVHALVESYSVMTRLPSPHRLGPRDAVEILESSFRARAVLVGLEGDEGWELIGDLGSRSVTGGTSYDGLILACAQKGGAQRVLTFNRGHFERLVDPGIEIMVPGSA